MQESPCRNNELNANQDLGIDPHKTITQLFVLLCDKKGHIIPFICKGHEMTEFYETNSFVKFNTNSADNMIMTLNVALSTHDYEATNTRFAEWGIFRGARGKGSMILEIQGGFKRKTSRGLITPSH